VSAAGAGLDRGVDAAVETFRRGIRPFAAPAGQARTRRATDVVILVPALFGLALAIAAYPPSSLELALVRFLAAIPTWLDPVWGFFADLIWLWAVVLALIAIVSRRGFVVGQALSVLAVGVFVGIGSSRLATGSWPDVPDAVFGTSGGPDFPDVRVAASIAVIMTISPHLVAPLRGFSRWVLVLGVVGAGLTGTGTPGGVLAAVLIGVVAAAAVNLALGTSAGRPGLDDVAAALAQLGIPASDLEAEEQQPAGVLRVRARDAEGSPLLVKVYGRDAADNQRIARLWRRAAYRQDGAAIGTSRLHAAEREAFVTLLVANAGIPTREVVTAGSTVEDDAVLVLRGAPTPLSALEPEQLDDVLLRRVWQALARLDATKVAHLGLSPETVVFVGDEVGFVELGGATVAPDESQLATDRAQLLMTTASLVGSERAVAAAVGALGPDRLASLLPYLQPAASSRPLRRALKVADIDVDDLRKDAAGAVGIEPPELVKLRRVTPWSAVQIGLLALAAYTIVNAAESVDWAEVWASVSDASWEWLVVAFVVAQLPRVTQSLATLGSVPTQLPFGPVYGMQLATGYMNVALPSNVARMAVSIRFFQRQGLSAPTAIASGAIDSFASTVIQAVLLVLLLVFSESSLAIDLPFPSGGSETLLWILVGVVVISTLVLTLVPRIRHAITSRVREWWPDVKNTLRALRSSHKLALLVLGSLGTEVLFALALSQFARAFGYDLSLAELLLVNVSVSLLGSLVPIPGNIGVAEFGLTVGLTSAGMSPESAVAAVLLYRIATYYLPPLWGFFAMQWLQRNRYL
jgi:uncharacterized protein (TIRG00374 family)